MRCSGESVSKTSAAAPVTSRTLSMARPRGRWRFRAGGGIIRHHGFENHLTIWPAAGHPSSGANRGDFGRGGRSRGPHHHKGLPVMSEMETAIWLTPEQL